MTRSRFPRVGHRLAPSALRELLQFPVPSKYLGSAVKACGNRDAAELLCDLDESSWERYGDATCRQLAMETVRTIGRAARGPMPIGDRRIPPIPDGLTLADLELEIRTVNCLVSAGMHERPQDLQSLTIEGILELRGFWVKSLVDLLTSIEYVTDHPEARKVLRTDTNAPIKHLHAVHRYPRPGHRLAPQTLKELLLDRLPGQLVRGTEFRKARLCDLDETAWDHLTPAVIGQLAGLILARAATVVHHQDILQRRLPKPPKEMLLEDLRLENRTYHCLKREGFDMHPERLDNLTVGELLSFRAFGSKCLIDLLSSLETRVAQEGKRDERLTAEAKTLGKMPEACEIQFTDPRLGSLLRAIDTESATIKEMVDRILERRLDPPDPSRLCEQIRELRERIQQLRDLPLEEELIQIFAPVAKKRDRQIVAQYFGWDGHKGRTLEELGQKYGLSRERIRQICVRVIKRSRDTVVFAPVLDRALAFLDQRFPMSLDHLQAKFDATGVSKCGLSVESVRRAAEFLSREPEFQIIDIGAGSMAVLPKQAEMPRIISHAAKQVLTNYGAAHLSEVVSDLSRRYPKKISLALIRETVQAHDDFCWLDEKQDWFRLTTLPQYGLPNMIEKALSVAGQIEATKLREALARYRRNGRKLPPPRILSAFCSQMPATRIKGKTIISDPPRNWRKVLTGVERCMVEVLKKHGPVMERNDFEERCIRKGMNRFSFNAIVMSSPVITQYARSVYGLLGLKVDRRMIEKVLEQKPDAAPSKVLKGFGKTKDGKVYLAYQLSKAAISGGVVTVPAAMKRQVRGKFTLRVDGNHNAGTLVARKGCGWGLGPALRGSDAEQGDHMILLFDTSKRQAQMHIGDETILKGLSDAQA